ncbi:MAG TPA: acyltransferase [Gemmatimonadaceae bacterium]|jgi:acetyltransferase-like isoleucine patch superfamily enzyme|nr:acyltransferase [Gemmatimonadaceae bacterium]
MTFARRLRKKSLKRWARNAFFPAWRVHLLRWCGYQLGQEVYIADELIIVEELAQRDNLIIGDRVSFGPRVTIVTSSHPNRSLIRPVAPVASGRVVIDADAWIGAGAIILPGVHVGRGAVIGAGSVVASDVPPLTVVAGQPAKVLRTLAVPPGWS